MRSVRPSLVRKFPSTHRGRQIKRWVLGFLLVAVALSGSDLTKVFAQTQQPNFLIIITTGSPTSPVVLWVFNSTFGIFRGVVEL